MPPLLQVKYLKTRFDSEGLSVRAVEGLSYDLEEGKTLAIVGESGSGKTVQALSILRLLQEPPARIASGEMLFKGRDLLMQEGTRNPSWPRFQYGVGRAEKLRAATEEAII